MFSLTIQGKGVRVYPATDPDQPIVYLNTFASEGNRVCKALKKKQSPDFTLVAIGNLDWNHDMAPWDIPPLSKHDTPCTGGADDFLQILTLEILPKVEKKLNGEPAWRGIAGYSLAGLFAVYTIYQTDSFSRVASMSGSFWFPGIKKYIFSHDMKIHPDAIYFSLGDKECKARNNYLKTVQDNTDEIQKFYANRGIKSVFQLNPGNHYVNSVKRTAAGIDWILEV